MVKLLSTISHFFPFEIHPTASNLEHAVLKIDVILSKSLICKFLYSSSYIDYSVDERTTNV